MSFSEENFFEYYKRQTFQGEPIPIDRIRRMWLAFSRQGCLLCGSGKPSFAAIFKVAAEDSLAFGGTGKHSREIWYRLCADCAGEGGERISEFLAARVEKKMKEKLNHGS
jgi:hypothetical protein